MATTNQYASFGGIVQFDPSTREVNNQTVRSVVIRALGSNKRVDVTLWPDFDHVQVAKGDFIVVDGKFSQRMGNDGKEWLNLSATSLVRIPSEPKGGGGAAKVAQLAADLSGEDLDF